MTQTIEGAFKGPNVVRFLKHLMRQIPSKLTIIWDDASIHRSKKIKSFLKDGAVGRLQLERLPVAACELNVDEGVWGWLKNDLANVCCRTKAQLKACLRRSIRKLRYRTETIFGFIKRTGLSLDL